MERSSGRRRRSSSRDRPSSPRRREERRERDGRGERKERRDDDARVRRRDRSRSRSRSRDRAGDHPLLRDAEQQPRMAWGNPGLEEPEPEPEEPVEKQKPDFGLSGALAKDTQFGNVYKGVVLKWSEPVDARTPSTAWRLYVFKGGKVVETLFIHRQSAYLIGREAQVADLVVAHGSCSKQHAVIQFRYTEKKGVSAVRPYIMDLESTNGTFLNGERITPSQYIELLEKDMLKFGESSREYVLLHDRSA